MAIFDDIKLGLEQAIEYEKGNLKAKKTTMTILPLETFTPDEIKGIRVGRRYRRGKPGVITPKELLAGCLRLPV